MLEIRDEPDRRPGRRVAAVEERVDPDVLHAAPGRQLGQRDEVPVMSMDAARPDQAHDRQPSGRCLRPITGPEEGGAFVERAVGDRGIDPREILEDRPSGAEVQVANLGVAHLARRQADGFGRGPERAMGPARKEAAPGGHGGGRDRVGGRITPDAEPVEDHEDDGTRAGRHQVDGPAGAPRAAAVMPARATMPAISSGLSEAPPTSAPSIEGSARNSPIVPDVTLPP